MRRLVLTHDDKTAIITDSGANLHFIDVSDALHLRLKETVKLEGIGEAASLSCEPRDELLLIGASEGNEFILYDLKLF